MKLIKEGAEAKLFLMEYNGKKAVLKKRICKKYRNKELNDALIKKRTKQEYSLLNKANLFGITVPKTYLLKDAEGEFIAEYIEGKRAKDALIAGKNTKKICTSSGMIIGKLHKNNIIHGDLTTSNFIMNKELVLFDFCLGFMSHKVEDKATDLLNLKKTFLATHSGIKKGWENITAAYCKEYAFGNSVLEKLREIENRARYK